MKMIPFPLDVQLHRLRSTAKVPAFATPGSVCFDLSIALDPVDDELTPRTITVRKGAITTVGIGWQFQMPDMCGMLILPRSGLSRRFGLQLANVQAVIDQDYTGEVMLDLTLAPRHDTPDELILGCGDRVVQARFQQIVQANFRETRFARKATQRGDGGFGSSGV